MASRYKISDVPLDLREYGRNVQMMVTYAKKLEDRNERTVLSHEIVRIMSSMNEGLKDSPDQKQKIWDHFYHLADYEIDIDSEYEIPPRESLFTRPVSRMPYNNKRSRFRQYGRNVELMAEQAMAMTDMDRRLALVTLTLNIMKMHLKGQEKDSNAEIIVCDHMRVMTKNGLDYHPDQIAFHKFNAFAPPPPQNVPQFQNKGRSNKGGNKGNQGNKHNHGKKKRRR